MKLRKFLIILFVMCLLPFHVFAEDELTNGVVSTEEVTQEEVTNEEITEDKDEEEAEDEITSEEPIDVIEPAADEDNIVFNELQTEYRVDKPQSIGVWIYLIVIFAILAGLIVAFFVFLYHNYTVYRNLRILKNKSAKSRIPRQG